MPDFKLTIKANKERAKEVFDRLDAIYPDAECSLDHSNPLELMVATILSAQCTDARVNKISPALFKRFPTAQSYADAPLEEIKKYVQTCGFYHNKAKNIQANALILLEKHGGEVPQSLEELVNLPGVGRKTANVVLGSAFGLAEGVVVDTHVGRISRRLGLTKAKDAIRAERDLIREIPRNQWVVISHRFIQHGRSTCLARKPRCVGCGLVNLCPKVGVPRHLKISQ